MSEATLHVGSGKVRELYALDDERLLLVASDRISVFDVVLPTEIPDKGRVLTGLSGFWFARTQDIVPNHLLALREDGRSTECKRLEMLPIECVVRGYITGSGWKDYKATGQVCGIELPAGLKESREAARADLHADDEGAHRPRRAARSRRSGRARRRGALRGAEGDVDPPLPFASDYATQRGIILADTKLEFGLDDGGQVVLADEMFTPDSSRFWPAHGLPGRPRSAVIRQAVRARLRRVPRLGQDGARPRAPGQGGHRHAPSLPRGIRAADRHPVLGVRGRPAGRAQVKVSVLVRPKPGILDPQGEAVEGSLRKLGFEVSGARVGRLIDLEVEGSPDEARTKVDEMCHKLLANPLIESYEIELHDA